MFDILVSLPAFALVLLRLGGFVMTAPIFASPAVPLRIRVAFTFAAALVMFPVLSPQAPTSLSWSMILGGALGEVAVGMTIGLSLTMLITAAEVAGLTIGQQAGMALGEVFNPTYNDQTSVMGQVYSAVFVLALLTVGFLRETFHALLDTFRAVPLLEASGTESWLWLLVRTLSAAFLVGLRLAAPVLLALLITSLMLGLISRTMPQLHVLSVGFTAKVMIALGIAALSIGAFREPIEQAVWTTLDDIRATIVTSPVPAGGSIPGDA